MRTRRFGKAHVTKWLKRFTHKRYRGRVRMKIHSFRKEYTYADLHLPLWKDVNDPWSWD